MSSWLKTGLYFIRHDAVPIARSLPEDDSLDPKPILKYARESVPPELAVWDIEELRPGDYILSTRGSYVSNIDDMVCAIPKDESRRFMWLIDPAPLNGPHKYIIRGLNGKGWAAPQLSGQVACHPLKGRQPGPEYPHSAVFTIFPVPRE